jgi:hypothetical protein
MSKKRKKPVRPTPPSLVYSDDHDPPLFVSGELGGLLCQTSDQARDTGLVWAGVLAELRPAERKRLGPMISKLREHALAVMELTNQISEEMDNIGDDRRALDGATEL